MAKSREMTDFLENMFGRSTALVNNTCLNPPIGCGKEIKGFRDTLSSKEYSISGLCQDCQDKVFGKEEE